LSILLKKNRALVVALLKRDLQRVKVLAAFRPTSALDLEHGFLAIDEWVADLEATLRGCFEDERKASDVTDRLNAALTKYRDASASERNPGRVYRTVVAQVLGVKGRVEKLVKEIDLFVEPEGLEPPTPEEESLVYLDTVRALTDAMSTRAAPPSAPARAAAAPLPARERASAQRATGPKVFISHSAKDEGLAEKVVDLLTSSIEPPLARVDIRCTSVAGCTLEGGAHTDEQLLADIRAAPVFIGLITSPSVASDYVLFELGARWAVGTDRRLLTVPLLGPSCTFDMLPGPWKGVNALRTDARDKVLQLVDDVARALGRSAQPPQAWDHAVTGLLGARGGEPEPRTEETRRRPKLVAIDSIIDARDLERVVESAFSYRALLAQVDRVRDSRIVDAAIRGGELDLAVLKRHEAVKAQVQAIFDKAQSLHPHMEVQLAKIERDESHGCDAIVFTTKVGSASRETRLDFDYLAGPEWGQLAEVQSVLSEVEPGPFRVETGKGEYEVLDVLQAVALLEKDGAFEDPLS
jgi:hypothetical protein